MSKAGDILLDLIRKNIERYSWTVLPNYAKLCVARSLTSGGLVGTALAGRKYAEQGGGLADLGGKKNGAAENTDARLQLSQLKSVSLLVSGTSVLLSLWSLLTTRSKRVFRQQIVHLVGSVGFGLYVWLFTARPPASIEK